MKVSTAERIVETGGTQQTGKFTIQANGKAFKVLIDGLYSDKIRAVIRELWTNAYDSHCDAGIKDAPFDCKMPTLFDPDFFVRDYGVSLTDDGVMNLYTTIFLSTKEDTNDQVGKLGLGSKSPFAYTDTFTVVAYLDGEKRTYSAYLGADGVPMISRFGVEATDEPNGLSVGFPVKADDCKDFIKAANRVIKGFVVSPNITGTDEVKYTEPEVIIEGEGWKLRKAEYGNNTAEARQGCVLYPLDHNAIPNLSGSLINLCQTNLWLDFPVGDLEIASNREALGYDEQTIKNIRTRLEAIEAEIVDRFTDRLTSKKTLWEARIYYNEIINNSGLPHSITQVLQGKLTWQGKKLNIRMAHDHYSKRKNSTPFMDKLALDIIDSTRLGNKALRWKPRTTSWSFDCKPNIIVVKDDLKTATVPARILHLAHTRDEGEELNTVLWVKVKDRKAFNHFIKWLGYPKVINASTLIKPKKKRSYSGPVEFARLKQFNSRSLSNWIELDYDVITGGLYVDLYRNDVIMQEREEGKDHRSFSVYTLDTIVKEAIVLGIIDKDTPIIGVPGTYRRVPHNNEGWVNLFDLVHPWLDENIDEKANLERKTLEYISNEELSLFLDDRAYFLSNIDDLESPIIAYLNIVTKAKQANFLKLESISDLACAMGRTLPTDFDTVEIDGLNKEINSKYTLLSTMLDHDVSLSHEAMTELVWYINHIDNKVAIDAASETVYVGGM